MWFVVRYFTAVWASSFSSNSLSPVLASVDTSCLKHLLPWWLPNGGFLTPSSLLLWIICVVRTFLFPSLIYLLISQLWLMYSFFLVVTVPTILSFDGEICHQSGQLASICSCPLDIFLLFWAFSCFLEEHDVQCHLVPFMCQSRNPLSSWENDISEPRVQLLMCFLFLACHCLLDDG